MVVRYWRVMYKVCLRLMFGSVTSTRYYEGSGYRIGKGKNVVLGIAQLRRAKQDCEKRKF